MGELRALDPHARLPRLEPAWGEPLPATASARSALIDAWVGQPEPGALGAFADGELVALALAHATACGLRIVAVHGDLDALLAAAVADFAGQRLEVQCEGAQAETALARAGFTHVLDQVHYRAALGPVPPPDIALSYEAFADVGARGLRRLLEAIWPDSLSPTGRTALEEQAELRLAGEGGVRLWRVAFLGDDPVGVALAHRAGDEGMLRLLGVVAHRRGEGLGRALHRAALRLLREHGATHYVDTTGASNVAMRRLLEAAGGEPSRATRLFARAPEPATPVRGPADLRRVFGANAGPSRGGQVGVRIRRPARPVHVPVDWEPESGAVIVGGEPLPLDRDGSLDGGELRVAVWSAARRLARAPLHRIPIHAA
jgi:GNAT superfamily N-acetyltransferase